MDQNLQDAIGLGLSGLRTTEALEVMESHTEACDDCQDASKAAMDAAKETSGKASKGGDASWNEAIEASKKAHKTSKSISAGGSKSQRVKAHLEAAAAHGNAADLHATAGNDDAAQAHFGAMDAHIAAIAHGNKAGVTESEE